MSSDAASTTPTEGSTKPSRSFGEPTSSPSTAQLGKRKANEAFSEDEEERGDIWSGKTSPPSLPRSENKDPTATSLGSGVSQLSIGINKLCRPTDFSKVFSHISTAVTKSSNRSLPNGNDLTATAPPDPPEASPGDNLIKNLSEVRFRFWDSATGVECRNRLLNETVDGDRKLPWREEDCKLQFFMSRAEFDKEVQNVAPLGEEMGSMTRLLIECNERISHSEPGEECPKPPNYMRWSQAFPSLAPDKAAKISLFNKLAERGLEEKRWLMLGIMEGGEREGSCTTTSSSASQIGPYHDV
ncbi:hypothetical protein QFC21_003481 [Naganishia friedmannii]|uniref:Uncharacterized protein n=1 Tax=Naganishia friedmannii TaxID=89922 RepID=A0ACC2VQR8_9TREE|nr:hypothetical protein QFC21_003481 [Naganishia friedmannii]